MKTKSWNDFCNIQKETGETCFFINMIMREKNAATCTCNLAKILSPVNAKYSTKELLPKMKPISPVVRTLF